MRIAVYADKFSGTLTSDEVIDEIKKIFKYKWKGLWNEDFMSKILGQMI